MELVVEVVCWLLLELLWLELELDDWEVLLAELLFPVLDTVVLLANMLWLEDEDIWLDELMLLMFPLVVAVDMELCVCMELAWLSV